MTSTEWRIVTFALAGYTRNGSSQIDVPLYLHNHLPSFALKITKGTQATSGQNEIYKSKPIPKPDTSAERSRSFEFPISRLKQPDHRRFVGEEPNVRD